MPQHLGLLEGGLLELTADMLEVVVAVLVVAVLVVLVAMMAVVLELVEGVVSIDGFGTLGLGQIDSPGQNSQIFSKRYHKRVGETPDGRRTSGRSVAVGLALVG